MAVTQDNGSGGSSFSLVVIRRILDALEESGNIKKTNLAGKTGLNYPNCIRYIDFLNLLGWVLSKSDGTNCICITELGRKFRSVLPASSKMNEERGVVTPLPLSSSEGPSMVMQKVADNKIKNNRLLQTLVVSENYSSSGGSIDDSFDTNRNIMLVDDEPDVLLTYKVLFAEAGYNVESFIDGMSAIQNLRSAGPSYYDLIVTDIRMKKINGLQLYREIKSIDPNVKVIFLSALDAVEELVSILPGVTSKDIVRKPIDSKAFVQIVKNAIKDAQKKS